MRRQTLFYAAALTAWIAPLCVCADEPMSSPSRATPVSQEAAFDEIQSIRRQIGAVLEGTSLQATATSKPSEDFAATLRQVAGSSATDPEPNDALDRGPTLQGDNAPSPFTSESLVPSLRHAARELEAKAETLENVRDYRRADRLRALARRLRREARQHDIGRGEAENAVEFAEQSEATRR